MKISTARFGVAAWIVLGGGLLPTSPRADVLGDALLSAIASADAWRTGKARVDAAAASPDTFSPGNIDGRNDTTALNATGAAALPNRRSGVEYAVAAFAVFHREGLAERTLAARLPIRFPAGARPGAQAAVTHAATWDGRDAAGMTVADGKYECRVVFALLGRKTTGATAPWPDGEALVRGFVDTLLAGPPGGDDGGPWAGYGYDGVKLFGFDDGGCSVTVDNKPPSVTIDDPRDGEEFCLSPITVAGTAWDASGLAWLRVNGIEASLVEPGLPTLPAGTDGCPSEKACEVRPGPHFKLMIDLALGENTITAVAQDAAGNRAEASVTVTYALDVTPPVVVIDRPALQEVVHASPVTVSGRVWDDCGVARVLVNGVEVPLTGTLRTGVSPSEGEGEKPPSEAPGEPWATSPDSRNPAQEKPPSEAPGEPWCPTVQECGLPTRKDIAFETMVHLTPGENTITVVAEDVVGNRAEASVTVTYSPDVTPPELVITFPSDGETTCESPVMVGGLVTDDFGVAAVYVNGTPVERDPSMPPDSFYASVDLTAGDNVITVTAVDVWGNQADATVRVTFIPDTGPPQVAFEQPRDGTTVSRSPVRVAGTVRDDTGVAALWVAGLSIPVPPDGRFETWVDLAPGENHIYASAIDVCGRWTMSWLRVTLLVDETGPTIEVDWPLDGEEVWDTPVDVIGRVYDDSGVQVVLVNGIEADRVGDEFYGSAELVPGANVISVVAIDNVGNRSEVTVRVTLAEVGPAPGPADGLIHGTVYDGATGTPLAGAQVSSVAVGRSVLTDAGGKFAFPVPAVAEPPPGPLEADGTREVLLEISKDGYLSAVRTAEVPRHPFRFETSVEPAHLAPRDARTTVVGPEGGIASNSTGTVFLDLPAGALGQAVEIRVTEYVAGRTLPMPLPATTQFTYAANLEPDGVVLSAPGTLYVSNYLRFPAGTPIPVGWFDGERWVDVGMSYVSDDGAWVVWDDVRHFSPFDANLPVAPGPLPPRVPHPRPCSGSGCEPEDPCRDGEGGASTTLRRSGTLRESITVGPAGRENGGSLSPWPVRLVYASDAVAPRAVIEQRAFAMGSFANNIATPYTLSVQGRRVGIDYRAHLPIAAQQAARMRYLFDGRTTAGDLLPTGLYPYDLRLASRWVNVRFGAAACFGCPADGVLPVFTREPVEVGFDDQASVSVRNDIGSPFGAGWWLAGHKRIVRGEDGTSWVVHDGDGTAEMFHGVRPGDVMTVAGNGTWVYAGSDIEATRAATWQPSGVAFDGEGRMWIAHRLGSDAGALSVVGADGKLATVIPPHGVVPRWPPHPLSWTGGLTWSPRTGLLVVARSWGWGIVFRVTCDPDATGPAGLSCRLERFAGGGWVPPAEGMRATDASLYPTHGIAANAAGEVFVPTTNNEVWKVDTAGILRRFAGTRIHGYSGDGGPAAAARLNYPSDVAVDADGAVYIADTGNAAVRRVDAAGTITTVVGNGTRGWTSDGQLAAGNPGPPIWSIAVSPGGEMYLGGWRGVVVPATIRKVGRRGELVTVVGNLNPIDYYTGEGVPGPRSGLGNPLALAFSPAGDLVFADQDSNRVRRVAAAAEPASLVQIPGVFSTLVALPDGSFELRRKGGTRDLFDPSGRHTATVALDGSAVTYEYDRAGRVAAVVDQAGRRATLHYDRWGKLSRITDFSGARTLFTVDSAGNLVRVEMESVAGTARTFAYNAEHLMVSQTDAGRTNEYAYDANRMVSSVRVAGRHHRTIAAADGRFLNNELAGRTGVPLPTSWDQFGLFPFTAVVTDERGITREYAYSHRGVMTGWRRIGDDSWKIFDVTYEVDANGLATKYSLGAWPSPTYEREYDTRGNLVWEWSSWLQTIYRYDPRCDRPTHRSQAVGWDRGSGTPFAEDRWEYDSSCRLVRHVDPAGLVTRYAYDPLTGLLAEESDDAGWKVRYRYDSLGRATRIEQRDGSATEMEYDAADRVIREVRTGADGVREETRRTYDALGRLVFVDGPGGALTEYRYGDGFGGGCCGGNTTGPTMVIDPDGNVTQYEYDVEGRVVAVIDPTGARTTREYAPGGLLARSSDPARRTTTYDYDWNRRLSSVTDPASGATRYTYPLSRPDSAVDTVTDAESRVSRYTWGSGGSDYRSVAAAALPDSSTDTYRYDVAGRLQEQTRATSSRIGYSVDGAGRVQRVLYHDLRGVRPSGDVRYTYDTLGRISRVDDFSGRTDFAYDAADRIAAETRTQEGRGYATRYAYDGLGNVTQMTYPSGLVVRFERQLGDPSRLSRVVAVDEVGVETVLASDVNYTTAGLLTGYTMGNGLVYAIERGPGGRVERITTGLPGDPTPDILDLTYSYDSVGNITAILDAVDTDRTAFYRYDALDRLVGADGWWGSLSWTYDRTGNRLSETRNGVLSSYGYQSSTSRLLEVRNTATGATEHTLEYDASGNATRYDNLLLDYDAADRLIRMRDRTTGATVQENLYDFAFRRTSRSGASARSIFIYDDWNQLISEHDPATGRAVLERVYLDGWLLLAARSPAGWIWYVADHLGIPRTAADHLGSPTCYASVEPFSIGLPVCADPILGSPPAWLSDGPSRTAYAWNRHYAPDLAGFLQVDPLSFIAQPMLAAILPPSQEREFFESTARGGSYCYCAGSPMGCIDPDGAQVRIEFRDPTMFPRPPAPPPGPCEVAYDDALVGCITPGWILTLGNLNCTGLCRIAGINYFKCAAICTGVAYLGPRILLWWYCRSEAARIRDQCRCATG